MSGSNRTNQESTTLEESFQTQWDNETLICLHFPWKISYQILHDGNGSITEVAVSVATTSISSKEKTYKQQYSVSFHLDNGEVTSVENKRSGNPGYIFELPTLARISSVNSDDKASHMTIMGLGDSGKCNEISNSIVSITWQ